MDFNYKKLTPFKWFVLQNFPFIDEDFDAITNYQLFCKLGEEINKLIESQNMTGEQIELLTNSFNALKDYVDNYFDNLDITEEINAKIDEMAEDGTIAQLLYPYLDEFNQRLDQTNTNVSNINRDLNARMDGIDDSMDTLDARMTEFASLPDGSTAGDAELLDIRIAYNGVTYDSAGDAVRGQIEPIANDIESASKILGYDTCDLTNVLKNLNDLRKRLKYIPLYFTWINKGLSTQGVEVLFNSRYTSPFVKFPTGMKIKLKTKNNDMGGRIFYFNSSKEYVGKYGNTQINSELEITTSSDYYYRFVIGEAGISEGIDQSQFTLQQMIDNVLITYENPEFEELNNEFKNQALVISKLDNDNYLETTINPAGIVLDKVISNTFEEYNSIGRQYNYYNNLKEGDILYLTGRTPTTANIYPGYMFLDENNYIIEESTIAGSTRFENYKVVVPLGATQMYLNGSQDINTGAKKPTFANYSLEDYPLNIAEALIREAKKNPFAFSTFDKGYISFVFDDSRSDVDLVASIFAEYGYKLGLATIPSNLSNVCDGLSESSEGYTPGMTVKQVCDRVVTLGGEIMAHNSSPVINVTNQYDYDFMHKYFVTTKKQLEENGYNIRGLIRTGGTGAISGTPQIEKWLIGNYEYSNQGTAVNYAQDRVNITTTMSSLKSQIESAYNNHTWIKIMGHGISETTSGNNISESDLREILSYCQTLGITVVTYADMFDNFSSSQFLNSL